MAERVGPAARSPLALRDGQLADELKPHFAGTGRYSGRDSEGQVVAVDEGGRLIVLNVASAVRPEGNRRELQLLRDRTHGDGHVLSARQGSGRGRQCVAEEPLRNLDVNAVAGIGNVD